uniref:Uncharacterized protein n=1 Tax=viral metagenome TaxID=1070528 RepID=A0A6C0J001_9ZZZZ
MNKRTNEIENETIKKQKTNDDKDFVKDGLSTEDIKKTVKAIRFTIEYSKVKDNALIDKLKKEYEFFSTRYPMLFDMAVRFDNFDYDSFDYMIKMREKIINNNLSVKEASEKVGKEWFDKYKPNKK